MGPSHGGANEAVLKMLDEIGSVENVPAFMEGVKNKTHKLMGFGHRVYKNMDPRANIMRQTCYEVLKELGLENDPKLKLAMALEKKSRWKTRTLSNASSTPTSTSTPASC